MKTEILSIFIDEREYNFYDIFMILLLYYRQRSVYLHNVYIHGFINNMYIALECFGRYYIILNC